VVALAAASLVVAARPAAAQVPTDVRAFGDAPELGSPTGGARQVAIEGTSTGAGYWVADRAGEVQAFGDADHLGDLGELTLNAPVVGMAAAHDDTGYWLAASDGGVFTFGTAAFRGSAGAIPLNQPIVDLAVTPSGGGYWLAASDGGVFAYGDARFHGSMGGIALNSPVVGIEATESGDGYWLVAADGGIFAFGDAPFRGSAGDITLNQPITAMAAHDDRGYWLVGADGGVFTYGRADFLGSLAGSPAGRVVDVALTPTGRGYWLLPAGTPLEQDCEGNGYRVAYPTGWSTNDGSVVDRCTYFDARPLTVPVAGEFVSPAITIDVIDTSASSFAASVRSSADQVLSERGGVIDGVGSIVLEWTTPGESLLPAGARLYAHVAPFPDGRALLLITRSVANGSYELNRAVLDEMAATMDIIALDVDTSVDTHEGTAPPGGVGHLVDARVGRAPGFDRLVLEVDEDFEPSWTARYLDGPARRPGSGAEVDVDGVAVIQIDLRPIRTHDLEAPGQPATYPGPERLTASSLETVTEAVLLGDFEAVTSWAIGVDERAGFRVFHLSDPSRVVIDINH
jgi:hypothetical protein